MKMYKPFLTDKKTKITATCALYTALLFVLSFVEGMLDFSFAIPGVKLGLSNLVVVLCVCTGGFLYSFFVTCLKILINSLFYGGFSSFLFTAFGSVASFLSMWILKKCLKNKVTAIGISTVGGFFHITVQYFVSACVMGTFVVMRMLPIAVLMTLFSSVLVGIVAQYIIKGWFEK